MASSTSFTGKKIIERFPLNVEFTYQRVNNKRCRRYCSSSIALALDQMYLKWRLIVTSFEQFALFAA